jgi:hypothetical protein
MKLLLFLGFLVIFISCFFIFFTFDHMVRAQIVCSTGETFRCDVSNFNMTIVIGIVIVGIFIFLDTLVVQILLKAWV